MTPARTSPLSPPREKQPPPEGWDPFLLRLERRSRSTTRGDGWSRARRVALSLALVVGVVVACASVVASAQDSPSTVDDLLEQAIRLREQRRDVEALPLFRRAYDMWPSPRTEAQLGLAHQAVGDWAAAYRFLAAALSAPDDPWIATRRGPLEDARRVVRAEVGLVVLRGGPPGGEVVVAGRVVATLPAAAPVAVAPGRVTMELRASGHLAQTRTVDVARGQQIELSAELAVDPSSGAPSTLPSGEASPEVALDATVPRRRRARRGARGPLWAWVATGAAAAMAAGAGIAWWQAGEGYADLEAGCGRTRSCTDSQIDRSGAAAAVTWTNVLLVGTAVTAAGAVILFIVEPSSGEEPEERGRGRAAIGVGPGSVVVRGRF